MTGTIHVVTRRHVAVVYARTELGPRAASAAFTALDTALGGRRGRRLFGWAEGGEYRACATRRERDDPDALGLGDGVLAGGPYARARHYGPYAKLSETFAALAARHRVDGSRSELEEYRSDGDLYALLPIRT